jgi:hypothetical protein
VTDLGLVVGELAVFGTPPLTVLEHILPAELRELHVAVCAGRISELEALTRARRVFVGASPAKSDLVRPGAAVRLLSGSGRERQALLLARLLLSGVEATGVTWGDEAYHCAADLFVEAGSIVLHDLLAGPLYAAVTALADERLARARKKGDQQELLEALERAASARECLTLEGRDLAAWADESAWRLSLRDTVDESVVASPNIEVLRMPDVLPELRSREEQLQELVSFGRTPYRSRALTQLVHVSRVLGAGSSVSTEDRIALAREAAGDPASRMEALQQLDHLGAITQADRDAPVFSGSLTDVHRRMGSLMAVLTYRGAGWLAMRLGRHDEARQLTQEYLRLPVYDAPEDQWLQALDVAVHCNDLGVVDCDQAETHAGDPGGLLRLIPAGLQPLDQLTAHVHAALHAANLAAADVVLERKGSLRRAGDAAIFLRMLRYVRGRVALNEAAGNSGVPAGVERRLRVGVEALRLHAELEAPLRAGLCAEVVARLVYRNPGLAEETVSALLPVLDRALSTVGPEADAKIAKIGDALVHPLKAVSSDVSSRVAFFHSQLFKGLRSAKVVAHSGPFPAMAADLAADEELWRQELVAAQETPAQEPPPLVPNELMTLLYATGTERLGGGSAFDELRNLRFAADMSVRERLYRERLQLDIRRRAVAEAGAPPNPSRRLMSYEELRSVLGTDTVLVDFFDAAQRDGNYGFYIHTYNASHSFAEDAFLPDLPAAFSMLDRSHPGRVLHGASTANFVTRLRRRIQEDPGPRRPIIREGADMLRQYPIFALGHDKALPLYREQGAQHVCLWPHGALHYAPLHLFDLDGGPLADKWTVTTVATPASLMRPQAWPDEEDRPALTVSVLAASSPDGGVAAGYRSLPELARQAEAVAATASGSVLLEPAEATPAAILAMLPHCRYAHLAAHGNADVYAPSFQALHFTGEGGRGRLTARQVMRADLRNVDLVTLAACESGLGRFDRLDNHAGLSAALLGAGVTAVVSCLWEVHPAPAALFFMRLYEALAATKGGLRAAFRSAQLATRDAFPAYRDWGAFVYSGGW